MKLYNLEDFVIIQLYYADQLFVYAVIYSLSFNIYLHWMLAHWSKRVGENLREKTINNNIQLLSEINILFKPIIIENSHFLKYFK